MWVRIGLIALRLLLRLAPFLAIAGVAIVRRYRWRVYYGARRFWVFRAFPLHRLPMGLAMGLLLFTALGVLLYLLTRWLAPG